MGPMNVVVNKDESKTQMEISPGQSIFNEKHFSQVFQNDKEGDNNKSKVNASYSKIPTLKPMQDSYDHVKKDKWFVDLTS